MLICQSYNIVIPGEELGKGFLPSTNYKFHLLIPINSSNPKKDWGLRYHHLPWEYVSIDEKEHAEPSSLLDIAYARLNQKEKRYKGHTYQHLLKQGANRKTLLRIIYKAIEDYEKSH